MITEYELYSDEREVCGPNGRHFFLGGVVCTDRRRSRLLRNLSDVRLQYGLTREIKWQKISRAYLPGYCAWVDTFFSDPFTRFSLFEIRLSDGKWTSFSPRPKRRPSRDDRLASAFYQFLLLTFSPLRDTKRWWVFPDAGLFSQDKVLRRIEFLFNLTYRQAFGPRSSRVIRLARSRDSARTDLVQLADVLLGVLSCKVLGVVPHSSPKAKLVRYCAAMLAKQPRTCRKLLKVSNFRWVPPDQFSYTSRGARQ